MSCITIQVSLAMHKKKKMAKRSLPSDASTSTAKHRKSGVKPKGKRTFLGLRCLKEIVACFVCGVESTAADQKKLELEKLLGMTCHVPQ